MPDTDDQTTTETTTPNTEDGPETTDDGPAAAPEDAGTGEQPDTFPRSVVEKLRRENATYRERAGRADALAERLMAATVRDATAGILADPTDLTDTADLVDDDGYPDPDKITDAARSLVEHKPHLADRRPRGDIGQGARHAPEPVDLAEMLRSRAG